MASVGQDMYHLRANVSCARSGGTTQVARAHARRLARAPHPAQCAIPDLKNATRAFKSSTNPWPELKAPPAQAPGDLVTHPPLPSTSPFPQQTLNPFLAGNFEPVWHSRRHLGGPVKEQLLAFKDLAFASVAAATARCHLYLLLQPQSANADVMKRTVVF